MEIFTAESNDYSAILQTLMIRCTMRKSNWFGAPMIPLPPHLHKDWMVKLDNASAAYLERLYKEARDRVVSEYQKKWKEWRQGRERGPKPTISAEKLLGRTRKLRVLISFPGFCRLARELNLSFTKAEKEADDPSLDFENDSPTNPYFCNICEIVRGSLKIGALEAYI